MNQSSKEFKQPEKKVDLSWKERVERERRLNSARTEPPPRRPEPEPAAADKQAREPVATRRAEPRLGPPTFSALVTQLAMQTMFALGLVQTPDGNVPEPDLEQSRYLIDLVGVLEQKTAGNLTEDEQKLLNDTLHDLRMAYLSVSRQ